MRKESLMSSIDQNINRESDIMMFNVHDDFFIKLALFANSVSDMSRPSNDVM